MVFTLVSTGPQHSLYQNLSQLPLNFLDTYSLSGMILQKNQVGIYLQVKENEFILNKIYKTEKFENWDKCFISIVEQSLVPKCWVYTKKPKLEPIKLNTWENLEKYLFTYPSSNNTSLDSSVSQASSKKVSSANPKTLDIKSIIIQPNPTQNKKVKEESQQVATKDPEENKNLSSRPAPNEKKWECPKCSAQIPLKTLECSCKFLNKNLFFSQNSQPGNNCNKCKQPSLGPLCRVCLSETNGQFSTFNPPTVAQGYETVAKRTNFNAAVRASSLGPRAQANPKPSAQPKKTVFLEDKDPMKYLYSTTAHRKPK